MLRLALTFALAIPAGAQIVPGLTIPPSGNNQRASVTQQIGPVRITIDYSSPAVHGPDGKDRRGQIWGKLVPYGLTDLGYGNGKPGPWRAGANENTVFKVSDNVSIEGKPLPAGRYGLHMIPGPEEWVVIFSKDSNAWGSFYYDAADDALRVTVKPHKHEYREWLTYEFPTRRPAEAVAELQWEELADSVDYQGGEHQRSLYLEAQGEPDQYAGIRLARLGGGFAILRHREHSPGAGAGMGRDRRQQAQSLAKPISPRLAIRPRCWIRWAGKRKPIKRCT